MICFLASCQFEYDLISIYEATGSGAKDMYDDVSVFYALTQVIEERGLSTFSLLLLVTLF